MENNQKLTKEQKMNMYILANMVGKVGRFISFTELDQYPLEQQYQKVKTIKNCIKSSKGFKQK